MITATAFQTSQPSTDLSIGDKITFTSTGTAYLELCASAQEARSLTAVWQTALSASGVVYATKNGSVYRVRCVSGTATADHDDLSIDQFVERTYNNGLLYTTDGAAITPDQLAALVPRSLILNAASAGATTGWLPIAPNPERLLYQLTSGSTATGFAVDVSEDGVTALDQAFTGTWARSDLAFITGLISFSHPRAKFFRVTVTSGGPLSMARGA